MLATRVVLGRKAHESSTRCLKQLHWLPIQLRIEHKILTLVFKALKCKAPEYLKDFALIQWKKAPLNDINALDDAFQGVEYVYHCAAKVSFADHKTESLKKSNIEGTANVVNVALKHKVKKLAYVSSIASIGAEKNIKQINEESNWEANQNHTAYAYTKYGAELEVWRASQEGLPVVIINPGVILGGQLWNRSSASLFQNVANGLRFYPTGETAVVALNDVINILIYLMESDIKNERFILVSENKSFKEVFFLIADSFHKKRPYKKVSLWQTSIFWRISLLISTISGKTPLLSKYAAKSANTVSTYSANKIKKALNFKFQNIEEVVKDVIEKYPKTGF